MQSLLAINWEPQLRGILIIIISVGTLCGSIYMILATNLGARLGFLLSLAGLAGWMMLMGLIWWAFGIGLKGDPPSWQPVTGEAILLTPEAVQEAGLVAEDAELPPDDATPAETADQMEDLLVDNGWTVLAESDASFGQSAASGGVVIEEDGTLGAGDYQVTRVFDKGGRRWPKLGESWDFLAFRHEPHYILVEVAPLVEQRDEPGRAPARAEIDETQPRRYVYMYRDLGNGRMPAALFTIGSGLVFFAACYLLHTRDKRVALNRSAGLVVAAKE